MNTTRLEQEYDAWHRRTQASDDGNPLRFPWYRSVFPYIKKNAHGDILEVGCGRGEFAVWLAEQMPTVRMSAIDFSEVSVGLAKDRAANAGVKVDFRRDDAQSLSFPDDHFDHVVSCECLEHVLLPGKMAFEIFRVLKPGGKFCLTTENYLNGMLIAWAHCWLTGRPFNSGSGVQPHENFFLFWRVLRLLRSVGLAVDATESCHVQWLLLPGVDPGRLCTDRFTGSWARFLAKPFGRHFSFFGHKPKRTL
jgi:2-polyprenyl-3-methyl-5-hydroxy-6-metoxy-1,4-benzoquinol methylase